MKKLTNVLALIILAGVASVAYAACSSHTVFAPDGRVIVCTTCCSAGNNCTTSCI
jgi:hypothetical protein